MLEQLLADLAGEYPAFREVFLDERDIYLTYSLQDAAQAKLAPKGQEVSETPEPKRVVGVVGIGHVPGITRLWSRDQQPFVKDILTIPPQTVTNKVIRYTSKASLLVFGGYLIYRYAPVPTVFRENALLFVQKVMSGIKTDSTIKYTIH
ncbi:hypothetical protein NQ318_014296 [Aromia moschata]|uniref:TraB domain-containing protein n=1 Tax=Aromia moschata TaxID=1265417 RepID=A0AAV8YYK6_9CUCU|nr:hypothetical protein NQ318_014296 [Aromia moschata]